MKRALAMVMALVLLLGILPLGVLCVTGFAETAVVNSDVGTESTYTRPTKWVTTTVRTKKTLHGVTTATVATGGGDATFGQIFIKEGDTPLEKGLNFGGKTFKYAYYGTGWDQDHTDWHADFEQQYGANLAITGVSTAEYTVALCAAMASGDPYDIVFLYSFDYPEQITSNVMVPLDNYITTADLWDEDSGQKGGFSESLMRSLSLNGHIYCVAGAYRQSPTVLWYNKKLFAAAGYDGKEDPLALYKTGKWTWEKYYEILSDIKDPDKGLWGINSIATYYEHQFINSFDTDVAKLTADGRLVHNLSDPNLYSALEMLQKYSYGENKVADPNNPYENGIDQFLNGTTASVIGTAGYYWTFYDRMQKNTYAAFGEQNQQLSNLGAVPIPNKNGVYSIWDWMGYGAGNGATDEGIKCALAFAKHDSIVNHKQAYHPNMTAEMKNLFCGILDGDKLRGPMDGFSTSAGSLGGMCGTITNAVAIKGQNITVVLKGYEKVVQTIINEALKGVGHNCVYSGDCDVTCNICNATRETSVAHSYDDDYDAECNVCRTVRKVPCVEHTYDDDCDAICNVCEYGRKAPHKYDSDCDTICNVCEGQRTDAVAHTYIKCNPACSLCGETRTVVHIYSSDCDWTCNICGDNSEAPNAHRYTNPADTVCDYCDGTRTVTLDHILITNQPNKLVYNVGEAFDRTGMVVKAYYDTGDMEVTDYTVSGDLSTNGTKLLVVSYGGKTATVMVVVEGVAKNGWQLEGGKWYFYNNGQLVKNSWKADSKGWCYVGPNGYMLTNAWVRDSVGWCYVGADGYCVTNCWKQDSNGWCYLDAQGRMATNKWIRDSQGWCYVGSDGYCVTNCWKRDSVGWVYLNSAGRMATNCWVRDSVGWCYVGADGYAVTNCWKRDSVGWCYLNGNGSMTKSQWLKDGGKWYYLDANGYMVTGTRVIGGKTYKFNASGVWIG